ncbi:hypothetical protein MRX96_042167 [Rhipicephalus microplus]
MRARPGGSSESAAALDASSSSSGRRRRRERDEPARCDRTAVGRRCSSVGGPSRPEPERGAAAPELEAEGEGVVEA